MIEGLTIEDRNGVIVLSAPITNPFTGDIILVPLLAWEDMGSFRRFVGELNTYLDKYKIPDCFIEAFND